MYRITLIALTALVLLGSGCNFRRSKAVEKTDEKISIGTPVLLGAYSFNDNIFSVFAQGTWTSKTKLGNPIQTSNIDCWQDDQNLKNVCVEFTASIYDGMLLSNQEYWVVDQWNDTEITTKPHDSIAGCTRLSLKIDRLQKQVTKTRTTLKKTGECAKIESDPIFMHLGSGSDILQN